MPHGNIYRLCHGIASMLETSKKNSHYMVAACYVMLRGGFMYLCSIFIRKCQSNWLLLFGYIHICFKIAVEVCTHSTTFTIAIATQTAEAYI